jgi:hypothetical protein
LKRLAAAEGVEGLQARHICQAEIAWYRC